MMFRNRFIVLAALLLANCDDEPERNTEALARPVKVLQVTDSNLIAGRTIPGQARSVRESMLSFRVAGRIQERRVKTGDQVAEGDVLAVLTTAPFQAELDAALANLQRAQAAYVNAASVLDRDKQLFDKGIVARARFEDSSAAAEQALAEVKSLEAAHERAKLELSYTELRAPFSGIVSAVFAEVFEEVKPQDSVMRLIDPSEFEMLVNVPESLISFVPYVDQYSGYVRRLPRSRNSRRGERDRRPTIRKHAHLPGQALAQRRRTILPFCRAWPERSAASRALRSPASSEV